MNKKRKEELKKLALDTLHGEVFTDVQVEPKEMIYTVFVPLALMNGKQRQDFAAKKPYRIYEYINKAMPRSINGMPVFGSFSYLLEDESKYVEGILDELREAEKRILEK